MIVRQTRALCIVQNRCRRAFLHHLPLSAAVTSLTQLIKPYIVLASSQICLLLFPKEVNPEILHQRRKHIRDVLECLRALLQRVKQLALRVPDLRRYKRIDHFPARGRQRRFAAAGVWGAEEEDGIGGDEDGMEVLN